ncbi:MAG TPA: tRNA (adenosine(37)-N6)-threonylcarbamoyltransferase complex ATPase subunit type 1 TsaE [Rhizomicrobium sp.]|jgi:tRNA threonylcarbamoyladenosine biosynthesis protein TsaE|nr:tRNA (adenosine(37)-N6)-threonylcarbamoyltransferase complex ATPase subunit type 1 TsaE [Rhizomicrobium sp.]
MSKDSQRFERIVPLPGLAATQALGARIAASLKVGDAVALQGDLGTGKTTLARAILHSLGVTEEVPSPTFTLVQYYETPGLNVRHYDLYRIENPSEVEELGLDEALDDGAALIEWPERALAWLPADRLHVSLSLEDGARRAQVTGPARWAAPFADAAHG